MKLILFLLFGFALPVFAASSDSSGVDLSHQTDTVRESRPYIIEEISPSGQKLSETKGISSENDPFLIAKEVGANPYTEDRFSAFPSINLGIGSKITLFRAPDYKIKDGKKESVVRSWTKTVGDLLTENKIELGKDDKINFSPTTEIESGMKITIIRVAITQIQEKQPIDFQINKKNDNTIDQGKTVVSVSGQAGERTLTYEVHREDGEEVFRKLLDNSVTKKTVDEILLIGTKPVITVRCKFNDTVIAAAQKYGTDANAICTLMMKESNGNPDSGAGSDYQGLFQYTDGFWSSASAKAGYSGASILDTTAQIYTTAWAFTHGERKRWP